MMTICPRAEKGKHLLIFVFLGAAFPLSSEAAEPRIDFARDVRPIFASRCVSCHGGEKQRGGLRLDRAADALKGGDSGLAIVPKSSAKSPLVQRIESSEKSERMPPTGERLTAGQIATLKSWIDQGAVWPADDSGVKVAHWAFRPMQRPEIPLSDHGAAPIDILLGERLKQAGLQPQGEADRRTLIRRLKFDLLGLPPTPEEVAAFIADPDPLAYERLVDRFLASPHFGERWARHWLDVVRFGESDGFETNQPRPNAWPYRDYVIRAFNTDMPYDRFIREQIAGDSYGADEATGFLVGGPWDRVKSPDVVLTRQQRADELHDIVSTTGSAFLGLTVGCARCHNHKFDPISQVDYHAVKACFAGVQHGERPWGASEDPERPRRLESARRELADAERRLANSEPLAQPAGPAQRRLAVNPRQNTERITPTLARFVRFTVQATNMAEPCIDELEVFGVGSARNVALAEEGAKVRSSGDYPGSPAIHRLAFVNDGRYGNSRSWISNEVGRGWLEIELKQPVMIERIVWGRDREGKFADRLATRYQIEVALERESWHVVASSHDRLPPGVAPPATAADLAEYRRLSAEVAALSRAIADLERPRMAYAGKFTTPEPTPRLQRGDPMHPKELVAPGALGEFGPRLTLSQEASDRDRRRALADWIVRPDHPLTARVIVNRLWQHHFGVGLVDTPSDFGINGARPSHPELLDWLASELIRHGWRLKPLHRQMVLSAAYRRSGRMDPKSAAVDADSRLLWRFPPRRHEAEVIRDSLLSVSGSLDRRMGGPGFDLFEPNTNYVKVYNSKSEFGPAEWRRMIYQHKPRMQLDNVFGLFDCPDAGQIAPKRTVSTTALQALSLLNSRFLLHQAERFTLRVVNEAGGDPGNQVERAFLLAFQRLPTSSEAAGAVELVRRHGLPSLCRALMNANEFVFLE